MAANPMQRKTRNAFILGVLAMLLIAGIVVALLVMKLKNQEKELTTYKQSTQSVWVLNRDVESGQVLTADMFTQKQVSKTAIPAGATSDIAGTLDSYSLSTKDGKDIYYNVGTSGDKENQNYYYILNGNDKRPIYKEIQGNAVVASYLLPSDKAFYYTDSGNTQRVDIEIVNNAVIAKVELKANTVITTSLITRADERVTDDLRKEEYNVISLPVDLAPGEYVDIRFVLPNGQNYIVVSKKRVEIPMVNGEYLADTIQMNLTEEENLVLSCAILEYSKIAGAKLYASRYTEAGLQEAAIKTYQPNNYTITLIKNDKNIVKSAIQSLNERGLKDIDNAVSRYGDEESIPSKVESSITATQEQRRNYLQGLQ